MEAVSHNLLLQIMAHIRRLLRVDRTLSLLPSAHYEETKRNNFRLHQDLRQAGSHIHRVSHNPRAVNLTSRMLVHFPINSLLLQKPLLCPPSPQLVLHRTSIHQALIMVSLTTRSQTMRMGLDLRRSRMPCSRIEAIIHPPRGCRKDIHQTHMLKNYLATTADLDTMQATSRRRATCIDKNLRQSMSLCMAEAHLLQRRLLTPTHRIHRPVTMTML